MTKITLFEGDIKESLLRLTMQKEISAFGYMEETLLVAIKNTLAANDIAITNNTAYFLACKFFGTHHINKWDKTRYSELSKYDAIKKVIDSSKVIISEMDR